jgi:pyruvate dehydrogenase (quinone)
LKLITLEAESVGLPPYKQGIEFPNPDFAVFARACGGHGFKATSPGELNAAISDAFKVDGPAIIDCVVAADEMPNLPHVNLEMVGHYAMARSKKQYSPSPDHKLSRSKGMDWLADSTVARSAKL